MGNPPAKTEIDKSVCFEKDLLIIESYLDTFGHINNAAYLRIFEDARWDIIDGNGYGIDKIRASGMGPTILDISIKFRREIKNRQKIKILSYPQPYTGKVGQIIQQMVNEEGKVCCEANFTVGLFDTKARKLIAPTQDWLKAVGRD